MSWKTEKEMSRTHEAVAAAAAAKMVGQEKGHLFSRRPEWLIHKLVNSACRGGEQSRWSLSLPRSLFHFFLSLSLFHPFIHQPHKYSPLSLSLSSGIRTLGPRNVSVQAHLEFEGSSSRKEQAANTTIPRISGFPSRRNEEKKLCHHVYVAVAAPHLVWPMEIKGPLG